MNRRPPKAFGATPVQGGFSLIELMVAMTLGLLLITGVGYVYLNAKGSFNSMQALASLQEVARFNFEYMGEDIRMASSTGGPASGGSPINAVNTPTSFDPRLIDLFDRPLMGYEQGGTFPTGLSPSPLTGTDAVTLVHADTDRELSLCLDGDTNATCLAANPAGTFELRFATCPTDNLPAAGQIFVAADYTHVAVFQITSAGGCSGGAMTLGYGTSSGTPGNSTTDLGAFTGAIKSRKLYPLKASTYYMANNADNVPTLYVQELGGSGGTAATSTTELADWVTNMQIEYGVDADATAPLSVDAYFTAAQVTAGTNGTTTIAGVTTVNGYWQRVLSVRVTLTLTSRTDVKVTNTGTALTKTFTTTFALRNRLL